MMNDENFHKDVDDIEFKCNELIAEIDEHLILNCEPQNNTLDAPGSNCDPETIIPNEVVMTCHNKLINFALNCCKAATKIPTPKYTDTVQIHIPKDLCCNLTKINQLLVLQPHHLTDNQFDSLDGNLEVRHLKHVNIDPSTTRQIDFKVSRADEKSGKSIKSNVGTFNIIHKDNTAGKTSKQENFLGYNFDKLEKPNEENISSDIPSNKVRHFLFGNGRTRKRCFTSFSTNKSSMKEFKKKIIRKKNVIE